MLTEPTLTSSNTFPTVHTNLTSFIPHLNVAYCPVSFIYQKTVTGLQATCECCRSRVYAPQIDGPAQAYASLCGHRHRRHVSASVRERTATPDGESTRLEESARRRRRRMVDWDASQTAKNRAVLSSQFEPSP